MTYPYRSNAEIRKLKQSIHILVVSLYALGQIDTQEAEDESNDLVYEWTDSHFKNKNFQIVNQLFKQLTPNHQIHASTIISLLMGTVRAATEGHLPDREAFIDRIIHPELSAINLHKYRIRKS